MKFKLIITSLTLSCVALLYLPLLAVAVFSVNNTKLGFVWSGFTLRWYWAMLHNQAILDAAKNTLLLAVISTLIATLLGTLLALGLNRYPWPRWVSAFFESAVYLPVVSPDIIFAAAMVVVFKVLVLLIPNFEPGLRAMIIAHVTFEIAFVTLVVRSRLAMIGPDIEEAARDLYATSFYTLRKVTLPLLMPGIVAGALLAFTLSLDDFVISFMTTGPGSTTLPIYIYSAVKRGVSPELHALSTLIFVGTIVLVVLVQLITRGRAKTT